MTDHHTTDDSIDDKSLSEVIPYLDIDEIWRTVGRYGQFQVRQVFLVFFYGIAAGGHLLAYVFLGYEPPHICYGPNNVTDLEVHGINVSTDTVLSLQECSISVHGENTSVPSRELTCIYGNNYSRPTSTSVLSEWDYVCDQRDLGQFPQSLLMAGQGIGALLTFVADYLGRKNTLILSHIGIFVFTFAAAFVRDFWIFATLRFFTGVFQQGIVLSAWTYLVEIVPKEHRFIAGCFFNMSFALSYLVLAAAAYLLRDNTWRALEILLSSSSVHVIFLFFFMEESLRWLIVRNKSRESIRLLKKICRQNGVPLKNILLADSQSRNFYSQSDVDASTQKANFGSYERDRGIGTDGYFLERQSKVEGHTKAESNSNSDVNEGFVAFLKDPKLLAQSAIIWFAWLVNVLVYFSLVLVPSVTVSNRFLQFSIAGFMEIPVAPLLWLVVTKLKRRTACILIHLIGGIGLISSTILNSIDGIKDDYYSLILALALIGTMAVKLSFMFLFMFTPELFPTNIRNTGMGVASFCGRIGGVVAPFSLTLNRSDIFPCGWLSYMTRYLYPITAVIEFSKTAPKNHRRRVWFYGEVRLQSRRLDGIVLGRTMKFVILWMKANYVQWAPGVVFGTGCFLVSFLVRFVPETGDKELPQNTKNMKTWKGYGHYVETRTSTTDKDL